jgi:hypothetical protein
MSKGIICDQCGTALALDDRGEDEDGEVYAWLTLTTKTDLRWDACTVSCAKELLDKPELAESIGVALEPIANLSRVLKNGTDD